MTAHRWAELGLADFTAPVGPGTYVEVLAPVTPGHPVARWLDKVGGCSGWVLSTQVPSLEGGRSAEFGVQPPVATADGAALAFGRRTIRFVPARGGRTGIVAVDVHATDREHGTGQQGMLCHTMINFI